MFDGTFTVREIITRATERFTQTDALNPHEEAELIVAFTLGVEREQLPSQLDQVPSKQVATRIAHNVSRRVEFREPWQYIIGEWPGFLGLPTIYLDRRAIVPLEESFPLVDWACERPHAARVVEVGTGAGAMALAIKQRRPDLTVMGSDIDEKAIQLARFNAAALGLDVRFMVADGLPPVDCDAMVANLPYVNTAMTTLPLSAEFLDHQPSVAIYSGDDRDGLTIIRQVTARLPAGLHVALQHPPGEGPGVAALLDNAVTFGDPNPHAAFTHGFARG
jgi:release factor glutamine methyltransferase